ARLLGPRRRHVRHVRSIGVHRHPLSPHRRSLAGPPAGRSRLRPGFAGYGGGAMILYHGRACPLWPYGAQIFRHRVRRGNRGFCAPSPMRRGIVSVISVPQAFNEEELYVDLRSIFGHPLFLKCEGFNFAGSIKLKAATEMVEAADRDGSLTPDSILIESSSGNLGVALSMIAASKG